MYVTYLRSSSIGAYSFCEMKYFFSYVLGFREKSNKKAAKGTITHKALELLARKKLALQNGESNVVDDETETKWAMNKLTPDVAIKYAWDHYVTGPEAHHKWEDADLNDCRNWMYKVVDSPYSPMGLNVYKPECYFDYEIPYDWANYSYELDNGEVIEGRLAIKGTVDLILLNPRMEGVYELIDWKTGARKDWGTGKIKDEVSLMKDPQLLLYYYALRKAILPKAKQVIITINFINDGGDYPLLFDDSHLHLAENMLKSKFLEIKGNRRPRCVDDWRCTRLCEFGKTKGHSGKTLCQEMREEIVQLGIDKCAQKYGDLSKLSSYGAGGGSTKRDGEKNV